MSMQSVQLFKTGCKCELFIIALYPSYSCLPWLKGCECRRAASLQCYSDWQAGVCGGREPYVEVCTL